MKRYSHTIGDNYCKLTYHFDIFQVPHVVHFTLDDFEDDAVLCVRGAATYPNCGHSLLSLNLMLRERLPGLLRHEIVPLKLTSRPLTHRRLPCPQLGDGLELLDGVDGLLKELDIRVPLRRLVADSLEQDRILLQML